MSELRFDPTQHPGEKLQACAAEPAELPRARIEGQIAETVRADSRDRKVPTQEHVIRGLVPDLAGGELTAILADMAESERYADIKAIVAPSGRIYLFSEPLLSRDEAGARCLAEEAKYEIVKRIRTSSQAIVLTPAAELEALFPWPEPERRAALMAELQADERFKDIQTVTGPQGELYYHSDAYLSGNYGKVMMRARRNDAAFAISELVRDRSRMPAPTKLTLFQDRVFGLSPEQIEQFLEQLQDPRGKYADIQKMVHPVTGAVYLYSNKCMHELTAYRIMDWEEVGASQNP